MWLRHNPLDENIVNVMLKRSWAAGIMYICAGYIGKFSGYDPFSIEEDCENGEYDNCVGPYNKDLLN